MFKGVGALGSMQIGQRNPERLNERQGNRQHPPTRSRAGGGLQARLPHSELRRLTGAVAILYRRVSTHLELVDAGTHIRRESARQHSRAEIQHQIAGQETTRRETVDDRCTTGEICRSANNIGHFARGVAPAQVAGTGLRLAERVDARVRVSTLDYAQLCWNGKPDGVISAGTSQQPVFGIGRGSHKRARDRVHAFALAGESRDSRRIASELKRADTVTQEWSCQGYAELAAPIRIGDSPDLDAGLEKQAILDRHRRIERTLQRRGLGNGRVAVGRCR